MEQVVVAGAVSGLKWEGCDQGDKDTSGLSSPQQNSSGSYGPKSWHMLI
jgi:hypothetical protein